MWYLHKLMDGDLVNYIVVTRYDIDYNCEHICLGRSRSKGSILVDLHRLRGPDSVGSIITPKGEFWIAAEVAYSEGSSTRTTQELIKRCRNWTRQWPLGWSDAGVRGPRIHRGRILHIGDKGYWEAYCFDDEIIWNEAAAMHRVKNIHWPALSHEYVKYDLPAYEEALRTGVGFPEGCGAVANGIYYGDEFTHDEIENLDNDLYKSLVCVN